MTTKTVLSIVDERTERNARRHQDAQPSPVLTLSERALVKALVAAILHELQPRAAKGAATAA